MVRGGREHDSHTTCRIVRDYDQYIQRQFKRGASRQELNVSWLKKNELDFKRNMTELRDSIKTNWTTTGQELGKELRQFWQTNISGSRPASPARSPAATPSRETPPTLKRHLSHLDTTGGLRGSNNERANDFAAGYNLGLISSVRGWVRAPVFFFFFRALVPPHLSTRISCH